MSLKLSSDIKYLKQYFKQQQIFHSQVLQAKILPVNFNVVVSWWLVAQSMNTSIVKMAEEVILQEQPSLNLRNTFGFLHKIIVNINSRFLKQISKQIFFTVAHASFWNLLLQWYLHETWSVRKNFRSLLVLTNSLQSTTTVAVCNKVSGLIIGPYKVNRGLNILLMKWKW